MFPRQPKSPLRTTPPHNLYILIAPLKPNLEVSIRAEPRELIVCPRRSQDVAGPMLDVLGIEVGEAREVRLEEGSEYAVLIDGVRVRGYEVGDVFAGRAVRVEEQGWVCGVAGQRGEVDSFLVPVRGVCWRGVRGRDEGCEASVVRGVHGRVGGAELVDWGGCCRDVGKGRGGCGCGKAARFGGGGSGCGRIPESGREGEVDLILSVML